ncbi:MAG: hypothetical protein J6Z11_16570, partial [Candidatus Riflebacteria bacterium]|nr:hypothetical protein [Candidatus Riflebacteria bacterium]
SIPEIKETDLAIAYSCHSVEKGDTYYVFANCDNVKRCFTLSEDLTKGEVIVDAKKAGTTKITKPLGVSFTSNKIELETLTLVGIRVNP